jgi:hypothetical protein
VPDVTAVKIPNTHATRGASAIIDAFAAASQNAALATFSGAAVLRRSHLAQTKRTAGTVR